MDDRQSRRRNDRAVGGRVLGHASVEGNSEMPSEDWTPLPSLWPEPAASRIVGVYELLVFTQDGVPTCEVRYDVRQSSAHGSGLIKCGTADNLNAAKAAAQHETSVLIQAEAAR